MGYQVHGFLTRHSAAAEAALARWPFGQLKRLTAQFDGSTFRCQDKDDLHPQDGDDAWESAREQLDAVRDGIAGRSAQHPDSVFVFLEVGCAGGTCSHSGFHALAGTAIATFKPRRPTSRQSFARLMSS